MVVEEPIPKGELENADEAALHYAAGILIGLGRKYGVIDITIYYDEYRIKIEPNRRTP